MRAFLSAIWNQQFPNGCCLCNDPNFTGENVGSKVAQLRVGDSDLVEAGAPFSMVCKSSTNEKMVTDHASGNPPSYLFFRLHYRRQNLFDCRC
jgi:hypothetical protein